jgi:hypothetical protein
MGLLGTTIDPKATIAGVCVALASAGMRLLAATVVPEH